MLKTRLVPLTAATAAVLFFVAFSRFALASKVPPEDAARIMPVSQVRAGMQGYGLTVFKGARVERFDVKVLGVMPGMNMGRPLILVRIGGGELDRRPINIAEGMSGSPVYVQGKIIGAIAFAGSFAREPIGLVTPIEDMLAAWDPSLPKSPPGMDEPRPLPASIPVGQGRIRAFGITTDPKRASSGGADGTAWFRPLTGTVTVSGFSPRTLSLLSAELAGISLQVREGPGRMDRDPLPLKEGSAVGFSLVTGDVDVTAVGTVTYRRGDRILAFGHPFLQIGPLEAPMCTAWVHDVFTSYLSSFKLASPVNFVGASTHDLPFAVSARVGHRPAMVPVEVTMRSGERGAVRRFRASVVRHPLVTHLFTRMVALEALSRLRPYPGEGMAVVRTTVKPEGLDAVERTNLFFSEADVTSSALEDLNAIVALLQGNRFAPVLPERVSLEVTLYDTRQTAEVERVFTDRSTFRPGESVRVHVQLRPYRSEPVVRTLEVQIPENALDGRAVVVVQGGGSGLGRSASGPAVSQTAPPSSALEDIRNAVSVGQMLQRFRQLDTNNSLVARIILPSASFTLNGERLIGLSPVMEEALQTAGGTGLRLVRDEAKTVQPTGWVVQGSQMLPITIQRKSLLEKAPTAAAATLPAARTAPSASQESSSMEESSSASDTGEAAVWRFMSEGSQDEAAAPPSEGEPGAEATEEAAEDASDTTTSSEPASQKPAEEDTAKKISRAPAKDTTPGPSLSDVGRKTRTWLQHSREDFLKGESEGVAVSSRGELTPGYAFRRLTALADAFIWAVGWLPDGSIVAAAGTGGQVRKISPEGEATVLASLGPVVPACLAVDGESLWVGTAPDGGIWLIENGQHRRVASLPWVHPAALLTAGDGGVFVGGGGSGRIWKVERDGSVRVVADTGQAHVTALARGQCDVFFAATSSPGAVWRIESGNVRALFRAAEDYVCSLAIGPDGSVYAATGPRGKIYRLRDGAAPVTLVEKLSGAYAALSAAKDGKVLACDGSSLHVFLPDDTVLTSRSRQPFESYSSAIAVDGRIVIGTASGGAVWLAEEAPAGWFESAIHDAERPADWGSVRLATGQGGPVRLKIRTGNTDRPGAGWSPWRDVTDSLLVGATGTRYLQYRLEFSSGQDAQAVREVEFSYLPANRPPTVKLTSPEPGAFWSGEKEIRWSGSDPDKDRLTYQVLLSADGGRTWKPLEKAVADDGKSKSEDGSGGGDRPLSDEDLERQMREELDRHPDLPESVKKQMWESRAAFIAKAREREKASEARRRDGSGSAGETDSVAKTGDSSRKWDTRKVSDGEYLLKVVASDELSNGSRALTAEAVSGPLRICNTRPEVIVFAASAEFVDGRLRRLEGRADGRSAPVAAVEYRLDGKGEWATAEPSDGVFDQEREYFVINIREAAPGKRSVEVRVKDAAGNTASVSREVGPREDGGSTRR